MANDPNAWPPADESGLPATIAYLRSGYPPFKWREAYNFEELASFWLKVHQDLREQSGELERITLAYREGVLDATAFQQAFVPGFNQFLHQLEAHHRLEDATYFPKFRALDPRMQAGFDRLEKDHDVIQTALVTSLDAARGLVAALPRGAASARIASDSYAAATKRLAQLLARHLADEEDLVIPAMLDQGERSIA